MGKARGKVLKGKKNSVYYC